MMLLWPGSLGSIWNHSALFLGAVCYSGNGVLSVLGISSWCCCGLEVWGSIWNHSALFPRAVVTLGMAFFLF